MHTDVDALVLSQAQRVHEVHELANRRRPNAPLRHQSIHCQFVHAFDVVANEPEKAPPSIQLTTSTPCIAWRSLILL
ncbi:MAG TPA: hypothetical protein DCM28_07555 [Phycisphaerales bacterium]|nr:hypothetical protein [Phycisphaerales bacterium]